MPKFNLLLVQSSPEALRSMMPLGDTTADMTEAQRREILSFVDEHKDQLTSVGSSINLINYNHMPNYHGILIDDKILFLSNCRWQKNSLIVPHEPFTRYDMTTDQGRYMIKLYKSWVSKCEVESSQNEVILTETIDVTDAGLQDNVEPTVQVQR